jgi:hypothetical protein
MGKEAVRTLGQRGPAARQEAPMSTPQPLDAAKRLVSPPALLPCPHGGALLGMWHSLAWEKTGPTLERVLSLARRPGDCPQATCRGGRLRLRSAEAQQRALPGSTSGDEVLVRLGWLRQPQRAPDSESHTDLAAKLHLASAPGRDLDQPCS